MFFFNFFPRNLWCRGLTDNILLIVSLTDFKEKKNITEKKILRGNIIIIFSESLVLFLYLSFFQDKF